MTDDELKAIEARTNAKLAAAGWTRHRYMPERHWQHNCPTRAGTSTGTRDGEACDLCRADPPSDVPALVAEVRRLRGLIKSAEWFHYDDVKMCPWCGASEVRELYGIDRAARLHESDCPVFTPDGDVR
jgi:hypothetical protein